MKTSAQISKRAAEIEESIRQILYEDWDPIGVKGATPRDEYDSYIAGVYRILANSKSETELLDFLRRVEIDSMGLGKISPEAHSKHLQPVVHKLIALDVKLHVRD